MAEARTVSIERMKSPRTLARTEEFGNLEVVKITDLKIGSYQRVLDMKMVSRISTDWDMAVAGAILINRRENGDLYIVNGQHRTAAAQRAGETHILAQVVEGLNEEEEAKLRIQANVARPERALERFRARQIALEPTSLHITKLVEKHGGKITFTQGDHHSVLAVSTLDFVYGLDQTGDLLDKTLQTIAAGWGRPDQHTASTVTLRGVAYLINETEDLDIKRMTNKMALLGVEAMQQRGRAFRSALGGSQWINFARAIVDAYNERLTEKNRILFPRMGNKYVVPRPKHKRVAGGAKILQDAVKEKVEKETNGADADPDE